MDSLTKNAGGTGSVWGTAARNDFMTGFSTIDFETIQCIDYSVSKLVKPVDYFAQDGTHYRIPYAQSSVLAFQARKSSEGQSATDTLAGSKTVPSEAGHRGAPPF